MKAIFSRRFACTFSHAEYVSLNIYVPLPRRRGDNGGLMARFHASGASYGFSLLHEKIDARLSGSLEKAVPPKGSNRSRNHADSSQRRSFLSLSVYSPLCSPPRGNHAAPR